MTGDIVDLIRSERKRQKITQQQLSLRAGLGVQVLGKIEVGYTEPNFRDVVKIMKALKLGPQHLEQIWSAE